MIEGCCDCGGVRWTYLEESGPLTSCNCGLERRAGALWAYGSAESARVEGMTVPYLRGDRSLAFHHCPTCGVTTHWASLSPPGEEGQGRMAVNMRLAAPEVAQALPIRHFDGAESWRYLD